MDLIIQIVYFIAAFLFILGLKMMGSPITARKGIVWAGIGMLMATLITYFHSDITHNYFWMTLAIGIGGVVAYISVKKLP